MNRYQVEIWDTNTALNQVRPTITLDGTGFALT